MGLPSRARCLYSSSLSDVALSIPSVVCVDSRTLEWRYHCCSIRHASLIWSYTSIALTPPPFLPDQLTLRWRSACIDDWKIWVMIWLPHWSLGWIWYTTVLWSTIRHVPSDIQATLIFTMIFGLLTSCNTYWNLMSPSCRAPPPLGAQLAK